MNSEEYFVGKTTLNTSKVETLIDECNKNPHLILIFEQTYQIKRQADALEKISSILDVRMK